MELKNLQFAEQNCTFPCFDKEGYSILVFCYNFDVIGNWSERHACTGQQTCRVENNVSGFRKQPQYRQRGCQFSIKFLGGSRGMPSLLPTIFRSVILTLFLFFSATCFSTRLGPDHFPHFKIFYLECSISSRKIMFSLFHYVGRSRHHGK